MKLIIGIVLIAYSSFALWYVITTGEMVKIIKKELGESDVRND